MRTNQCKNRGRYCSLLFPALVMLVSACASTDQIQNNSAKSASLNPGGITPMTLMIADETGNVGLASRGQLKNAIKDFAEHQNPGNTKLLIAQMRASNINSSKNAPGFTGIGGALGGHEFLDIAEEALDAAGDYDQNGKRVVITAVEGQIIHYKFDGSVSNPGTGELTVITAITTRVIPAGAGNPPPKTVGYKWEIKVNNNNNNGFRVVSHSGNNSDPFPNTMAFSDNMLTRIESLGFQYKLWAKGENIEVIKVSQDKNFNWQSPNWMQLPKANPKWARLYESDSESCIDMMFVDPPPATFAELQGPPWYCLGRCAHPGIVNSR